MISARRNRIGAVMAAVTAVMLVVGGCSDDTAADAGRAATTTAPTGQAGQGPFFGECGGVTTDDVTSVSKIGGLTNTINNPSVCEWVTSQDQLGPQLSFNWYRGSPIGRERATIQFSRDVVEDVTIDGHSGFIGSSEGICEIGIEFGADFFEWSVTYGLISPDQAYPSREEICDVAKTLATQSIENAT